MSRSQDTPKFDGLGDLVPKPAIDWDNVPGNEDKDSLSYRMKHMAVEVVMSFIADILTIKQIKEQLKIANNSKSTFQEESAAKAKLDLHYASVNWFTHDSIESVWFEALGLDKVGKQKIIDLVHRKVEGEK